MLTAMPLVSRTMRKLGRQINFRAAAERSWVVEPAVETRDPPALYDEGDVAKVTGVPVNTTFAYQMDRLTRTTTRHPPVHAWLLRDVHLLDGHLFKWHMVKALANAPMPVVSSVPTAEVASAALAATDLGNRFFGHWLTDDLPLGLLAREHGAPYGHVGSDNTLSPHQAEYAERLGYDVTLVHHVIFRELLIFDDMPEAPPKGARYEKLRRRLLAGSADAAPHPGVMLLRKDSGQRRILVNEDAIAESLRARGFRIVYPIGCPLAELIEQCRGARTVVGVEGSQLAHAFLCLHQPGAMLTLQPPFKFDHFWRDRCECVSARYGFIVGDEVEGGFEVPVERVHRAIDRIEAAYSR